MPPSPTAAAQRFTDPVRTSPALQQTAPQPQPVLVSQNWPQGEVKVLVDPKSMVSARQAT